MKVDINSKRKIFEEPKTENEPTINIKKEEPKILERSKIISKENEDMIIFQYPNEKFIKQKADNSKIIIFIGDHPEQFINTFINMYRDIYYEDKFRYQIDENKLNNKYKIYYIKARNTRYDLIAISIPNKFENGEIMTDILNIFDNEKIPKKINLFCITLEEKDQLYDKGIITFLAMINIFEEESIKNKIMVLYSKNDSTSQNNEINKTLLLNEYCDIQLSSKYNPKYFFINNQIIYKKDSDIYKNQWNELNEVIQLFQKELQNCQKSLFAKDKLNLYKDIIDNDGRNYRRLLRRFDEIKKNQKILLINFLLFFNKSIETSALILYLYNKIINNKEEITTQKNELALTNDKNLNNMLYILSKVKFKNLEYVNCQKCNLNDNSLNYINNLFSPNLKNLDLYKNNLSDMRIFNNVKTIYKLNKLNLSNNKIININGLANCDFSSLKKLDLSHNEISDIKCFEKNFILIH